MIDRMKATVAASAVAILAAGLWAAPADATLIGVSGGNSSAGTAPAIIAAPSDVLNGTVANSGMQGFNEVHKYTTLESYKMDGGVLGAGSYVDSHMIFLNKADDVAGTLTHSSVTWTFDGLILGVMSDSTGSFEAASTPELGNPATNYPAAGFAARGLEGGDSYSVSGNMITVTMQVTQPGDWIRVVTQAPEPGTLAIFGVGLAGLGIARRRRAS